MKETNPIAAIHAWFNQIPTNMTANPPIRAKSGRLPVLEVDFDGSYLFETNDLFVLIAVFMAFSCDNARPGSIAGLCQNPRIAPVTRNEPSNDGCNMPSTSGVPFHCGIRKASLYYNMSSFTINIYFFNLNIFLFIASSNSIWD